MRKILYIGNKLANHGKNPTTIDILGERLKDDFDVKTFSDKHNQVARLIHMWISLYKAKNDVDLVLIDTYSTQAFHFAWTTGYLAKYLKIPYIPILHGGDLPLRFENSKRIFFPFLKNASAIVTPSNYLKNKIIIPGVKITLIPNFIDLKKYPFKERKKLDVINILWVRAFAHIYNPKLAIETLEKLFLRGFKEVHLTMVGPDKDGSMLETIALAEELGLQDYVKFTGKIPKKCWIELSKGHAVFINTSSVDNTPVSIMEAMVLGIPVISTNVGGIPYLITSQIDGIIIDKNDSENMANAIIELYHDENLYNSISLAARDKAVSWDWLLIRKKWFKLISQVKINNTIASE